MKAQSTHIATSKMEMNETEQKKTTKTKPHPHPAVCLFACQSKQWHDQTPRLQ